MSFVERYWQTGAVNEKSGKNFQQIGSGHWPRVDVARTR